MKKTRLMPWILAALMSFTAGTGCTTPKATLPQVSKEAVPKIELSTRPELPPFTPEEMQAIPLTAHKKVLKNQAEWWGYADIAEGAVRSYQDYIRKVFNVGNQ